MGHQNIYIEFIVNEKERGVIDDERCTKENKIDINWGIVDESYGMLQLFLLS